MGARTKDLSARQDLEQSLLRAACEACRRIYSRYPNVIGVGTGLKLVRGAVSGRQACIHFYVSRKSERMRARKRLPRFVYARRPDGKIDRSRTIRTDVIELRNLRFASRSGAELDVIGERGTLTLLFRNKVRSHPGTFLLTCAHVAGDVTRTPPADPQITLPGNHGERVFATTLVNATAQAGAVDYDIALARVCPSRTLLPDCEVEGSSVTLSAFLPSEDVRAGRQLDCAFPVSNVLSAYVISSRTTLTLTLDGRDYAVRNLFLIDRAPRNGDSGGLLYAGPRAAGILVGMADGFGLFQPLGEAFTHLQALSPVPIECFTTRTTQKGKPCTNSSPSASPSSAAACSPAAQRSSPTKPTSRKRRKASGSIRPKSI